MQFQNCASLTYTMTPTYDVEIEGDDCGIFKRTITNTSNNLRIRNIHKCRKVTIWKKPETTQTIL
jgi:hypothetical protein